MQNSIQRPFQSRHNLELVLIRIPHQHRAVRLVLIAQQPHIILDLQRRALRIILQLLEIEQQIVLDRTHGIGLQPRVVVRVKLCCYTNELRVRDHHMYMRRAIWVSAHKLQQHTSRPTRIDRILGRLQAVKVESTIFIGSELSSQVVGRLVLGIVGVVLAVCAGLPHVEDGVGDPRAGVGIENSPVEVCELAVGWHVLHDGGAEVAEGGVGGPEGTEDGGGGGGEVVFCYDFVVYLIDEAITVSLNHTKFHPELCLEDWGNVRLNTQNITYPPRLIAVLLVCLSD